MAITQNKKKPKSPNVPGSPGIVRGIRPSDQQAEVEARLDRLMNPHRYKNEKYSADWLTIVEHPGDPLTLDQLIAMKPYDSEDPKSVTMAFRGDTKMFRTAQRIFERAQSVYDIRSDLYRDIFYIGLMVMSERWQDIMGPDLVLERARVRHQLEKEIQDQVRKLTESLANEMDESFKISIYEDFIEAIRATPIKAQARYISIMEMSPMLAQLRRRMIDKAKEDESNAVQDTGE